jgi:replicative DNA helicase
VKAASLPKPPVRDPEGFVLPHNLEAERSLLGAALLHARAAEFLSGKLTAEMFFRRAHRDIFTAMKQLCDERREVDLVTLKQLLGKKLEDVGGPAYITSLTDGLPRATNIEHYADILRDLAARRQLVEFASRTLDLVAAGEHGAPALLVDTDRRLLELQAGHGESRMRLVKDSVSDLLADMEWRHAHKGELLGVETGFASLNELTFGWIPGDLVVIGARPSIGKTTFAVNSAVAAARSGKHVAIFSLEMKRKQLEYRILSELSQVPLSRILSGYMASTDWKALSDAIGTLAGLSISIDDRTGQSVSDIRGACRQLRGERGLDLAVVDYVQLMPGTLDRRGASRNDEVTDISRRLKQLADEVSIPILLLSQLTRDSQKRTDPRPKLSDLRESGALEQDADLVCFLHRKNHREGGTTEFILDKQRNGPTGTCLLTLDRDIVTFTDGGEPVPEAPKKEKTIAERYGGKRGHS